jgi:hypothetical protein
VVLRTNNTYKYLNQGNAAITQFLNRWTKCLRNATSLAVFLPDAQRVNIRCEAEPVPDFLDLLTSHEPDDPVPSRHKNVLRNFLARFYGITTR